MIPENTQHWPYLTISFSFQNCSRIAILPLHSQGTVPSSKSSGSPQLPSKRVEFTCDDTKEDLKAETIESSRTRYTRLPLASPTIFPANCFQNLRDTFWFHRSLWGRVKNDLSRNNCSIIWLFSDNEQCLLVNRTGLRDVKKTELEIFLLSLFMRTFIIKTCSLVLVSSDEKLRPQCMAHNKIIERDCNDNYMYETPTMCVIFLTTWITLDIAVTERPAFFNRNKAEFKAASSN